MPRLAPRLFPLPCIGLGLLLAGAQSATGADRRKDDVPLAPLLNCRAIAQADARLACFDREIDKAAGPAPATSALSAAGAIGQVAASQRSALDLATEDDVHGRKRPRPVGDDGAPAPSYFEAKIVSAQALSKSDRWQFTLEDGTVWQTAEASSSVAPHSGGTVRLERAAFGSYFATFDHGRTLRSKRVK